MKHERITMQVLQETYGKGGWDAVLALVNEAIETERASTRHYAGLAIEREQKDE